MSKQEQAQEVFLEKLERLISIVPEKMTLGLTYSRALFFAYKRKNDRLLARRFFDLIGSVERVTGFEPATFSLARRRSSH